MRPEDQAAGAELGTPSLSGLILTAGKRSVANNSMSEFYMPLHSLPKPPGMVPEDQKILPCL